MDYKHEDYVKYIQQMVESVCPYTDENLRRLYHAGFLASFLAHHFEKDPWNLKEFKRHIEELKQSRR